MSYLSHRNLIIIHIGFIILAINCLWTLLNESISFLSAINYFYITKDFTAVEIWEKVPARFFGEHHGN